MKRKASPKLPLISPVLCHARPSNRPASNYMFKVNNRITRTRGEICSGLTIKTPE